MSLIFFYIFSDVLPEACDVTGGLTKKDSHLILRRFLIEACRQILEKPSTPVRERQRVLQRHCKGHNHALDNDARPQDCGKHAIAQAESRIAHDQGDINEPNYEKA